MLGSLGVQERLPDEVLVADDGSGPETKNAVSGFASGAPFPVIHVWHEDKGFRLAKIRNAAIIKSIGDYIVMLDGDCVVNRRFVRDHEILAERGCFIQGKRVLLRQNASNDFDFKKANSWTALIRLFAGFGMSNAFHLAPLSLYPSYRSRRLKGVKGCNMGFFREDLLAVNGYNEEFIGWGREDSELAVRLFRLGLKKKIHQFMAICFHLWHPEQKRDSLPANDRILEATLRSNNYFCEQGIIKKN